MGKQNKKRQVNGDDLLYRFFQDLFEDDDDLAARLPPRMLASMAIWLPLDVYYDWPVLLPWVVRDPTCRGNKKQGRPDEWGAPNEAGYLRDDNSLIKAIPRSLEIESPNGGSLNGTRMGNEFVASHAWRVVDHDELASRIPLLNSFVPNLVWLPSQVSKLSDREGSSVQLALQGLAWRIYRNAPVADHLREVVEEAWLMIPEPVSTPVELPNLNWFKSTARFAATRRSRLRSVVDGLNKLDAGGELVEKIVTTRYTDGLPGVGFQERAKLRLFLSSFDEKTNGTSSRSA